MRKAVLVEEPGLAGEQPYGVIPSCVRLCGFHVSLPNRLVVLVWLASIEGSVRARAPEVKASVLHVGGAPDVFG